MERSAALIDELVASDTPVYGVTTGFGSLANAVIPAERTAELQTALVRSHATGMGDTVEPEVVRAMLLLRARSLSMARCLAVAMSQAPGRSGTPDSGHRSSAATNASWARSSASPTSRTIRASPAISLADDALGAADECR